jgi:hypothetical protein
LDVQADMNVNGNFDIAMSDLHMRDASIMAMDTLGLSGLLRRVLIAISTYLDLVMRTRKIVHTWAFLD